MLAGDWTATGLPATIEGSLRSGVTAARLARRARSGYKRRRWPSPRFAPGATLDASVERGAAMLRRAQQADGHWVYELEADATIPAEYILLVHYLGEVTDPELERKLGVYLRRIQRADGGWPLYHGGDIDLSATVKAYFALKMIGDEWTRRTWRARARRCWRAVVRARRMSSRASCWRCTARAAGRRCRRCLSS